MAEKPTPEPDETCGEAVAISDLKPSLLGSAVYRFFPVRRRVVMENLQQVFGDQLSEAERRRLAKCIYGHVAKTIKEYLAMMVSSDERTSMQMSFSWLRLKGAYSSRSVPSASSLSTPQMMRSASNP